MALKVMAKLPFTWEKDLFLSVTRHSPHDTVVSPCSGNLYK